jgi:chromosome partitioning protein
MKTIAVVTTKGGSGKTTIALNLALAAYRRGLRTLVADIDPQHSAVLALNARGDLPGPDCVSAKGGKLFQIQQTALKGGVDILVVDTPGYGDSDLAEAVRIADLCVVVSRPTFLDLAAAVTTAEMVRRFNQPGLAVLSQAPPPRLGAETPNVVRALSALSLSGLVVASVVIHSRTAYQSALMRGQGVEEWEPCGPAAREILGLWGAVQERLSPPPIALRPAFLPVRPPSAADLPVLR